MATHSSILAWRIPWMEEPGPPWLAVGATGYKPQGSKESNMTERLHFASGEENRHEKLKFYHRK